jgi:uncharacterized membrane protein
VAVAEATAQWVWVRRVAVVVLVAALFADRLAFVSGSFEHEVSHEVNMSSIDSGLDTALRYGFVLSVAILVVGLWRHLVARYRSVWS